jgi:hypothetical protein
MVVYCADDSCTVYKIHRGANRDLLKRPSRDNLKMVTICTTYTVNNCIPYRFMAGIQMTLSKVVSKDLNSFPFS